MNSSVAAVRGVGNTRGRTRTYIICALMIALLSCLLNFRGIYGGEVIDDHDLLHNPIARGCGRNPLGCFQHPQFGLYYRPLMGASFAIGEKLHGQKPLPFHVENVALHAMVVLEACWAFRLLLRTDRAALLAGLLYGVHPLQVPVTTFIGGRTDTLALVFLLFYVIATVNSAGGRFVVGWRSLSVAAFTAAIFTKEQCAPLVFLAPLLTTLGYPGGKATRDRHAWMALYTVPIVVLLVAARRVIPAHAIDTVAWTPNATRVVWDLALRIEMVGRSLWFYAKAFLWPTPHTLHQSSLGAWDIPQPLTAVCGFFAAGFWIALVRHTWPDRGLRVLSLWTALTLIPCLNIVPIPSQFVACYRAAIPLFGAAGLAGALCDSLIAQDRHAWKRAVVSGMAAAAATILAILSLIDVPIWRNDGALLAEQYQADPNFLPALAGCAVWQRQIGMRGAAIAANDRVVDRLFPTQLTLQDRLAVIDTPWMLRNVKSQTSLRYQPRYLVDYVMRERGGAKQESGLYLEAIKDYQLALGVEPDDYEVADALIYCSEVSGKYEDAAAELEDLIKRSPTSARLHRLGAIYLHIGRFTDAKRCLARALSYAVRERSASTAALLRLYLRAERAAGGDRRPR